MGGNAAHCSTAGDEVVDARTANVGTGVPDAATLVDHRVHDCGRGHRDEGIPNLHATGDGFSLAIPEKEEALPYVRTKPETEAHTDNAHPKIPGQSWSEEAGVDENGCGGNDDGCGDDDDKAKEVAGDAHSPSCMSASNASSPAMLALEGSGTGKANDHNRRVTAKGDGTDRPWET